MISLELQLKAAFQEFATELRRDAPFARENELVNLFAFGPLIRQATPRAPLADPAQVGVEVAVRQYLKGKGAKAAVRKDLVIWERPRQTAWSATGEFADSPLAVVEWKGGRARSRTKAAAREQAHDLDFLQAISRSTATEGYAVFASYPASWHIRIARVVGGRVQAGWFDSGASAGA